MDGSQFAVAASEHDTVVTVTPSVTTGSRNADVPYNVTLAAGEAHQLGHGFAPVQVHAATLDEWDHFESGYSARYARWLGDHEADHADSGEVRQRAARQRSACYSGYRGILGLAYLALIAV